jgi:hypothetical protein
MNEVIIIVDTENIPSAKNDCPCCDDCPVDPLDCTSSYHAGQQSLIAQAEPLSWLDEKLKKYQLYREAEFMASQSQFREPEYKPFSQFIQESESKQEANHE